MDVKMDIGDRGKVIVMEVGLKFKGGSLGER